MHWPRALGLITQPDLASALPASLAPPLLLLGQALPAPESAPAAERLPAQGLAMCGDNATCRQRWEAALPVYARQKTHRAVALGRDVPGLGFSDDQDSADAAAKRAIYLCNHAAGNKKLCRLAAVDDRDVGALWREMADASVAALAALPDPAGLQDDPAVAAATEPLAATLRTQDFVAATPTTLDGVRVIDTRELVRQMRSVRPVLIDVHAPMDAMLPGALHFWDGGLAFADAAVDAALASRLGDMLRAAAPQPAQPLVFYCRDARCWTAVNAARRAVALGYTQVMWYRGGLQAWQQARLPVVRKLPVAVLH